MVGSVLSVPPKFKERSICSFFSVRYHKRKTKANGIQSKKHCKWESESVSILLAGEYDL